MFESDIGFTTSNRAYVACAERIIKLHDVTLWRLRNLMSGEIPLAAKTLTSDAWRSGFGPDCSTGGGRNTRAPLPNDDANAGRRGRNRGRAIVQPKLLAQRGALGALNA